MLHRKWHAYAEQINSEQKNGVKDVRIKRPSFANPAERREVNDVG